MGVPATTVGGCSLPGLQGYRARIETGEIVFRRDISQASGRKLVSIVTQTLNSERTIRRALESVRNQSYPWIEHIIVDGVSRDKTMDIVMEAKQGLGVIVSGRDHSPADAANKGVAAARGDYISVLPSDDFLERDYVERCVEALERTGADFVFGDLVYIDEGNPPVLIPGDPRYARHIRNTMPNMSAITLMYRRSCFERVGLWDVGNPYSPDYDWLLRAHLAGLRGAYEPSIRGYFCHGGVSSANYDKAFASVRRVAIAHGASPLLASGYYLRAVIQKRVRSLLQRLLPQSLYFRFWSLVSRTGVQPVQDRDSHTKQS
jgi:glycosyltransferase